MTQKLPRALLFIDGNNWYHSLQKAINVDSSALDYLLVAGKLLVTKRQLVRGLLSVSDRSDYAALTRPALSVSRRRAGTRARAGAWK